MTRLEDQAIETLGATQLGVVTRAQLRQQGILDAAIDRRLKARRLRALHRGVYLVGELELPHARDMAAVLACGAQAALSFHSAGSLWPLMPMGGVSAIDVSIPQGDRGHRPGIRVHRVSLEEVDITSHHGIRVTTVSRTIVDLATVLPQRELERVLAQATRLNLLDRDRLLALTDGRAGRPGAPLLRTLLEQKAEPALTRSEAEERFLALIRKARLPEPETNVPFYGYEVDFLWRAQRLVIEVDGYAYHSSQESFLSDRRRDVELAAHGVSVLRVTWWQVVNESEALLVRLGQALDRRGTPGYDRQ